MPYNSNGEFVKMSNAVSVTNATLDKINPNKQFDKFDEVVNFIGSMAMNERRKEMDSIKVYCEKMKANLELEDGDPFEFRKLLDPEWINQNPEEFQSKFLLAFDASRHTLEQTITQIKQTKAEFENKLTIQNLESTNFRFSAPKELDSLIKSLIKQQTQESLNEKELTSTLDQQVESIMSTFDIAGKFKAGKDVAGIAAAIKVDLLKKLQNYLNSHSSDFSNFEELLKSNVVKQIGEAYTKELNEGPTRLQKALNSNDTMELQNILKTAESVLGLKQTEIDPAILRQYQQEAREFQSKQTEAIEQACLSFQDKLKLNPELRASLYSLEVNISTDEKNLGAAGNINEFIESVFQGGVKVRSNVATDLVTFHINYGVVLNHDKINKYMTNIADQLASIQDYIAKATDKYDITKLTNKIIEVNKNIDQLIKNLEKKLKKYVYLQSEQKAFIQLESLKLHAAGGASGNRRSARGFQGRTMAITSYISYLSSMASVSPNLDINAESLSFLAYNLLPGGSLTYKNVKGGRRLLADYFSLFSGMIMFDDVRNMALEITRSLESRAADTVETLHLYNLNGTYVPSSVVLENMYKALLGKSAINRAAKSFARANIVYDHHPPQGIQDIKVQITLLSGYEDIVNQLTSMMG